MKPFPPGDDLPFLVGLEVGQVCLDPWSTQLRFSDGGQLTLEGPFEHCDVKGTWHAHEPNDTQDLGPVHLRELIQQRITRLPPLPLQGIAFQTSGRGKLLQRGESGPFGMHPPMGNLRHGL